MVVSPSRSIIVVVVAIIRIVTGSQWSSSSSSNWRIVQDTRLRRAHLSIGIVVRVLWLFATSCSETQPSRQFARSQHADVVLFDRNKSTIIFTVSVLLRHRIVLLLWLALPTRSTITASSSSATAILTTTVRMIIVISVIVLEVLAATASSSIVVVVMPHVVVIIVLASIAVVCG